MTYFMILDFISIMAMCCMCIFSYKNIRALLIIAIYLILSGFLKIIFLERKYTDKNRIIKSVELKNVYLIKSDKIKYTAFCCFKNIFIEENIYNKLVENSISLNTIIFHEQYHLKHNSIIIRLIFKYAFFLGLWIFMIFSYKYIIFVLLIGLIYYIFSVYDEYMADQYALDFCSKEDMISMLKIVCCKTKGTIAIDILDIHPTLERRIKRILNKSK